MNRPSNRHPSWSWLLIGMIGCGLLLARMAGSFVAAQENPVAGTPPASVPPPVAAPEFLPRLSANAERILKTLNESTEIEFVDLPLSDALAYFQDLHKVQIWLDRESLSSEGIATDCSINLSLSGITLQSALRLLLEPLLLTYVIEDEVLKITTQEVANKRLVTRTYPAADLFESREEANELVEVIVSGLGLRPPKPSELTPGNASIKTPAKVVDSVVATGVMESGAKIPSGIVPDVIALTELIQEDTSGRKWETAKGETGIITVSVKARAIVARQTHAVHDEIRQLLRDLREAKALVPDRSPDGTLAVPRNRTGWNTPPSSRPLDEFSPGLNPATLTPRSIVPEPPERPASPEAAAPAKTKTGR